MQSAPEIYLIDNGSLRPQATFALRKLAAALSHRTQLKVQAVSLLHSHKIDPAELGGEPATIVKRCMREALAVGKREFILLPLFLGPSRAITEYLPEVLNDLREEFGEFAAVIAESLCGPSVQDPDRRLAHLLADHVRQMLQADSGNRPLVTLTDHGTPAPEVNQLRNGVADQLRDILGTEVAGVLASSMERRDGPEYEFNEPLLERLGQVDSTHAKELIVAMFFLLPGRHAGEGGDVAQICEDLIEHSAFAKIHVTALMAEHAGLLDILADRLSAAKGRLKASD